MATFDDDKAIYQDDDFPTHSSNEQANTEDACREVFDQWLNESGALDRDRIPFSRAEHAAYLMSGLGRLAKGYTSLDASRPWLCYWITHSLELLGEEYGLSGDVAEDVVRFLGRCQSPNGGFAGGPVPGQSAHLAPSYAAVNTLVTIGTPSALAMLDREALKRFLRSMRTPQGAFSMHVDGECDVRGAYTAIAIGTIADVLDDDLTKGTAEWIASCQTYEGGIGATPGEEAHGGYTFCGLAALVLLGGIELLDIPRLTNWLVHRQMAVHGGFQGRTNKLVDGCYSFWQGGAFPLLQSALLARGELPAGGISSLFSTDVRIAGCSLSLSLLFSSPIGLSHPCLSLSHTRIPPLFFYLHTGSARLPSRLLPSQIRRAARQARTRPRLLSHVLLPLGPRRLHRRAAEPAGRDAVGADPLAVGRGLHASDL